MEHGAGEEPTDVWKTSNPRKGVMERYHHVPPNFNSFYLPAFSKEARVFLLTPIEIHAIIGDMPKGQHFTKPFSIKNWKTKKIFSFPSLTACAEKLGVSIQIVSDINCGRRVRYGDFCMPHVDYAPKVHRIRDLRSGKVLEFPNLLEARKGLGIASDSVKRILADPTYRRKYFAHPSFNGVLPVVVNRRTGTRRTVFTSGRKDKPLYYLVNCKRIPANDTLVVEGCRDYKYKIVNKETGEEFFTMTLKDFAKKHGFKPEELYVRRKKNPLPFEIVEG